MPTLRRPRRPRPNLHQHLPHPLPSRLSIQTLSPRTGSMQRRPHSSSLLRHLLHLLYSNQILMLQTLMTLACQTYVYLIPLIRLFANLVYRHQTSVLTSVLWRTPRFWRTLTLTHSSTPTLMQRVLDLIQVALHTLQTESKQARTVCKFEQKFNHICFSCSPNFIIYFVF
jgi:hypothetical protein